METLRTKKMRMDRVVRVFSFFGSSEMLDSMEYTILERPCVATGGQTDGCDPTPSFGTGGIPLTNSIPKESLWFHVGSPYGIDVRK